MSIAIRRADSRGTVRLGEAVLRCHFAFGAYTDPARVHDGRLRVLNVCTLPPASGLRLGPEANRDVLTWVETGTLSTFVEGFPDEVLHAGSVQVVSTGTGVQALEWRDAGGNGASFHQFWFLPDVEDIAPAQETRPAFVALEDGGFRILASGFPEDDPEEQDIIADGAPVTLRARARLLHAALPAGEGAAYSTTKGRDLYLVVVSGSITIDGERLLAGDAGALRDMTDIVVVAEETAVVLLADTAGTGG